MPTKKKRVGFIPREDVMKIIDQLSFENNLSNSKIVNILVEEALLKRGIFNINSENKIDTESENNYLFNFIKKNDIEDKTFVEKEGFFKLSNSYKNQNKESTVDLETYHKFMLFIKFHDMISKYEK